MSVNWTAAGDFGEVVDGLETVTLHRRGSSEEQAIAGAHRTRSTALEPEPAGGGVVSSDADWEFELPAGVTLPSIGDVLIDGAGARWTILVVGQFRAATRAWCKTRSLAIRHGLVNRVTIQSAVWQDDGAGPEIVGWKTERTAVPARIEPIETEVDRAAAPPGSTTAFRVLIDDDLPLDHNHRLLDALGAAYEVDRYTQADRLDALAVVEATLTAEGPA